MKFLAARGHTVPALADREVNTAMWIFEWDTLGVRIEFFSEITPSGDIDELGNVGKRWRWYCEHSSRERNIVEGLGDDET